MRKRASGSGVHLRNLANFIEMHFLVEVAYLAVFGGSNFFSHFIFIF